MRDFMGHLLKDVQAFEYMLENNWFEDDIVRIGAEQEMCLVNKKNLRPACINLEVLEHLKDSPWCVPELAKFNLENNLLPREFKGTCLSDMEAENLEYLSKIQHVLDGFDADIVLCGILPTLRKSDLDLRNLTPKARYHALMSAIQKHLIGSSFELRLDGVDELLVKHDTPMLEACNTSYQVHLQVAPDDFVHQYNISQALAAPSVAMAANSPLVFGRRLWHESRIALFQQSLDTRTTSDHMRERSPRVQFGKQWLKGSILDIYREDISRFRVLLPIKNDEDSIEMIRKGKTPKLRSLLIHNGTVYRWNRPCYGISPNGKPHLRIENRVLPAGPSVVDEVANSAFWLGCMIGMSEHTKDVTKEMSFADARDNIQKASKFGIDSSFTWFGDKKISATELVLKELLPLAKEGLKKRKVRKADIDRYMDIIEARAKEHTTGARWTLRAYTKLVEKVSAEEALSTITAATIKNQKANKPVHTWKLPDMADIPDWKPSHLKVEEFMNTDLFTVQQDATAQFVAEIMDWRKIRYMPVEDGKGELVGLITSRLLLRHFSKPMVDEDTHETLVEDIMITKPTCVSPDTGFVEAMNLMRNNKIGCLPVIQGKELVGIVTEMDYLQISARLITQLASEE